MEESYMCRGMDEDDVEALAQRALLAWETSNKSVQLLTEFAKMARAAKDYQLVHFREYLWQHKYEVREKLWEIVETELALRPLEEDMHAMGDLAMQHLDRIETESKERWG